MPHYAVTAIGADRPGIVAAVTGVLMKLGSNLEDTSMSILRGHFAMMLIIDHPEEVSASTIEAALSEAAAILHLVVTVREIDDDVPSSPEGSDWTLSVYGADHPGIVHRVTALLAEMQVNVVDVTTRLVGEDDNPIYLMILELTLPKELEPEISQLSNRINALASELGVECNLHPSEADIL